MKSRRHLLLASAVRLYASPENVAGRPTTNPGPTVLVGYELEDASKESLTRPLRNRKAPRHRWPDRNRTAPLSLRTGVATACSCLRTWRERFFLDIQATPKRTFSILKSRRTAVPDRNHMQMSLQSPLATAQQTSLTTVAEKGKSATGRPRYRLPHTLWRLACVL